MQEIRRLLERLDLNAAIVSAIIEREQAGETQVLIQTRWKPTRDPEYSGTLEIPAGGIHAYENIYEAIEREVLEETGLHVKGFHPDIRTKAYAPHGDDCFAFVPFCCQQQLRGGIPRIGIVFICQVEDEEPVPEQGAVQDIVWMKRSGLRRILDSNPERIFTLQLPVLDYYLSHHGE